MIKCSECPRCSDTYPGKLDKDGYHFHICGMGGNIVYTTPHKIKRATGSGYISFGISSCGMYDTVEDALSHMTETGVRRWKEKQEMKKTETGKEWLRM